MASRKPTRRRTHLGFERLDERVTPAVLFAPTGGFASTIPSVAATSTVGTPGVVGTTSFGNSLFGSGTALSAMTGSNFTNTSGNFLPGVGSVTSFPSLTANTGATTGLTGFGTTTGTGTGTVFGGQPSASFLSTGQPSATAFFTGTPVSTAAGSTALGNLSTVLGATRTSTAIGYNPASNTSGFLPGIGTVLGTITNPFTNTTIVNPVQVAASTSTVQGLTPAFLAAFPGSSSLFGNTGLTSLGTTGLTNLGSGLGLGSFNLTNPGFSLATGLNTFPTTTIPSAITTGSVPPAAAPVAQLPATLSAFGASTRLGNFLALQPIVMAPLAPAAFPSATSTSFASVPTAALSVTPVAAPSSTLVTATPFQTTTRYP